MKTEFVIAQCKVYMTWTGPHPRYRVWVNDELFTERTWIWTDHYLEEMLQIQAPPGDYSVRYELVDPEFASIKIKDLQVIEGPCIINPRGLMHIYTPEV